MYMRDGQLRQKRGHANPTMIDLNRWVGSLLPLVEEKDRVVLDLGRQVSGIEGKIVRYLGGGTFGSVVEVSGNIAVKFCTMRDDQKRSEVVDAVAREFGHHLAVQNSQYVVKGHAALVCPQRELAVFLLNVLVIKDIHKTLTLAESVKAARRYKRLSLLKEAAKRFGLELVEATLEFPFTQLVTSLCRGGTLWELDNGGRASGPHKANLDIKGGNIFIAEGRAMVGDLGGVVDLLDGDTEQLLGLVKTVLIADEEYLGPMYMRDGQLRQKRGLASPTMIDLNRSCRSCR
eukprot:GHVS01083005.1.p1 GENE.GHVS01083005.1~~GHVS01083005.1.p1  ORF type:complete len:289 (+),score=36.22 GHVS01083005.1:433-1299(+)